MGEQFSAPPINPLISIQPLPTAASGRDAPGVPPQLANASPGTLVDGFVVNRDAQSNPILRTSLGDLLVKSDVFIKTGSQVVFRVDTTQAGHARIVTIDGLAPQDYAAQQARGLRSDTISTGNIASLATNSTQTMNLARGTPIAQPLQAVLLSAVPPSAASIAANPLLAATLSASTPLPAGLAKLQQGAVLKVNLLNVQPPQAAIAGQPAATTPPTVAGAQPTPPALPGQPAASALPATAGATPNPGTPVQPVHTMANAATARVAQQGTVPPTTPTTAPLAAASVAASRGPASAASASATAPHAPVAQGGQPPAPALPPRAESLPAATPKPAAPSANPNSITAVVIGKEKTGEMVLQSPMGTLKLMLPRPIPMGSVVQMEIEPATSQPAPTTSSLLSSGLEQATTLARDWPGLEDAMEWAQANDPSTARTLAQSLPNIGPKMTSGLLFFIAAVKGGDLRQLVGGKAFDALESKLPEIAARLKGDMGQLQQLFNHSPLQHWQTVMLPLMYDGQLEHARLFFRHDQQPDESGGQKQSAGKDQRFIVEVDLSHLGEMQFDGFVRGTSRAKQFDLIVRNNRPLPAELAEQIRGTFDTAMQVTGLKGYLAFQTGAQHFVRPMADSTAAGQRPGHQPILA